MRRVWPFAVLVSLATHGALLAGAQITWGPKPLPAQRPPEARLDLATQAVTASTADAAQVAGKAAATASAGGQRVGGSTIPQSVAQASRPASLTAPAVPFATKAVAAADPPIPLAPAVRPATMQALAAPVSGQRAADVDLPQSVAQASRPAAATAASVPYDANAVAAARPTGPTALPVVPDPSPAPAAAPESIAAPPLPPPSARGTAALAWSGDQVTLDPLSLAAIQAFMQPGDLAISAANTGRLRDGISATLSAVPCARLQTSFDPETGSIELRGHLPDDGLRAPVLAALQAQVGSALPVRDRLRLLPRPQCQVLGAIAETGLAQSTEQETNPRVVGPDTFVRDYDLKAGQQLVFDMTAPDYPAVIYVDYFDAEGNVLHMQPNDQVPAVVSAPKSALAVGQSAPGVPALRLIVGPPFGQEIAVAFATSVPLYDGVRPTVEPAGPYLGFLAAKIEAARASKPDFKGEWVYFFVTTAP